jgi:hypothetical protein
MGPKTCLPTALGATGRLFKESEPEASNAPDEPDR